MRLLIDVGTPLPEPPRDIHTLVNNFVYLEWSYGIAREVSGLQHRRSEGRYNERVVEKLYAPGAYVRVLQQDVISVPHQNLFPHIPASAKSSKSED